jgi:hypothetical protein
MNTDTQKIHVVSFVVVFCYYATFLRLWRECHIQNILKTKTQIASILINIGCNLTCFGPVQSFDVLILTKRKVGVACPEGALKTCKTHGGRMSLGALKHVKNGGGRMSVGCSQKLSVAHRPGLCYN